jgi:hypothetical protein
VDGLKLESLVDCHLTADHDIMLCQSKKLSAVSKKNRKFFETADMPPRNGQRLPSDRRDAVQASGLPQAGQADPVAKISSHPGNPSRDPLGASLDACLSAKLTVPTSPALHFAPLNTLAPKIII